MIIAKGDLTFNVVKINDIIDITRYGDTEKYKRNHVLKTCSEDCYIYSATVLVATMSKPNVTYTAIFPASLINHYIDVLEIYCINKNWYLFQANDCTRISDNVDSNDKTDSVYETSTKVIKFGGLAAEYELVKDDDNALCLTVNYIKDSYTQKDIRVSNQALLIDMIFAPDMPIKIMINRGYMEFINDIFYSAFKCHKTDVLSLILNARTM